MSDVVKLPSDDFTARQSLAVSPRHCLTFGSVYVIISVVDFLHDLFG